VYLAVRAPAVVGARAEVGGPADLTRPLVDRARYVDERQRLDRPGSSTKLMAQPRMKALVDEDSQLVEV
jgi:hypothetical protein